MKDGEINGEMVVSREGCSAKQADS